MFVEGIGYSTRIGLYYYFTRRYHIDFLLGGNTLTISADGFRTWEERQIVLTQNQGRRMGN
jgi:hypothetical protein